jgi:ribosomal protein S1
MTRIVLGVVLAGTAVLATPGAVRAQDPAKAGAAAQQQMVGDPVTVTATVEAIDKTNRLVTLKGEKGNVVTVRADESMTRFDELKVGDTVSATYYESVAVNVRRPGEPAPTTGQVAVTPSTGTPGKTIAAQETVTVTVMSVDKANSSVTVKKNDGSIVSMRVQNQKYLDMVKAGDTVDITFTAALLMQVKPAK